MKAGLTTLFDIRTPISRPTYVRVGATLTIAKYLVDASAMWVVARVLWTPIDYLSPLASTKLDAVSSAPVWFSVILMLWTLPFMWVGVAMTLRRLVDAGRSPWLSLLFFIPLANWLLIGWLALAPSSDSSRWETGPVAPVSHNVLQSALKGVAASVLIGLFAVIPNILVVEKYGLGMFLAAPFVVGIVSAYIHNRPDARSVASTLEVGVVGLLIVCGALLLLALEGVVCMVMALPMAVIATLVGSLLGREIAIRHRGPVAGAFSCILLIPLIGVVETVDTKPAVFVVTSSVTVDADAERVWNSVLAFEPISTSPGLMFRLGIAYPMSARLEGEGVGAVRYCTFSTGSFVEPITVWDPGRRLAFDVTAQPPPMREVGLYGNVNPPHLDDFFRSRHGEFRLADMGDGQTLLEGSTHYTLEIYPHAYWRPLAEWLLHRIHYRVLEAVRDQSEEEG